MNPIKKLFRGVFCLLAIVLSPFFIGFMWIGAEDTIKECAIEYIKIINIFE